ncbi:MAG: hypothetical protein P4L16_04035 [Chlamydiales bacterium]|nr:hypothetical protein [Chlamydiales bacterium]
MAKEKKLQWWVLAFWVSCGTFFLLFALTTFIATTRKSGVTGIDAGQLQRLRYELNQKAKAE